MSQEIFKSNQLCLSSNHHHLMFVRTSAWRCVPIIFTCSPRKVCISKVVTKAMIFNLLVMKTKSSRVPRRGRRCNRHWANMPSQSPHIPRPGDWLSLTLALSLHLSHVEKNLEDWRDLENAESPHWKELSNGNLPDTERLTIVCFFLEVVRQNYLTSSINMGTPAKMRKRM